MARILNVVLVVMLLVICFMFRNERITNRQYKELSGVELAEAMIEGIMQFPELAQSVLAHRLVRPKQATDFKY